MPRSDLNADVMLALAYAGTRYRRAFTTLFLLDAQLNRIVTTAREPQLARIKLAWWNAQLASLDTGVSPVDPLLIACEHLVCCHGVIPATLAAMAAGYDELVADMPLPTEALTAFSSGRGSLFLAAAQIASVDPAPEILSHGSAWALVDYAFGCCDPATARTAIELAQKPDPHRQKYDWPRSLRPFRLLSRFARYDLIRGLDQPYARATPRRLWHVVRALTAN